MSETLKVMLEQEQSGYIVCDYLSNLPASTHLGVPVDAEARALIVDWVMKIMDACNYRRETAAIAIDYLDRYTASTEGYVARIDRSEFQLAALASVYTAVKINEEQTLSPEVMAQLSNGERTKHDVEKMELRLLQGLRWRVNPPTAMSFIRCELDAIQGYELQPRIRQALLELSEFQINLTLSKFVFTTARTSLIAFAALLNAAESIGDVALFNSIENKISNITIARSANMASLRSRLYELVSTKELPPSLSFLPELRSPSASKFKMSPNSGLSSMSVSPRSVAAK